jgi:cytochrome c oxidase assembly factor CtaG
MTIHGVGMVSGMLLAAMRGMSAALSRSQKLRARWLWAAYFIYLLSLAFLLYAVLIGMLAMGLLAALIAFANRLIYPSYAFSSSGGRSPLADQHLGGGMMWLIGTAAIALAAVLTMRDEG